MRKIFVFMMVSLDGFIEGKDHDLSWHNVDEEFNTFAVRQMDETDTILFGRKTYQLMESFWPTQQGLNDDPLVAAKMNETQKIVFSKTLDTVRETDIWKHVTLVKDNLSEEIQKLKNMPGKDIAVLGSNNLCVTLLKLGLLDEIRLMINPVVIGEGTTLFLGMKNMQKFHLKDFRQFTSGNVLLTYTV